MKNNKCPLCKSSISEDLYLKVKETWDKQKNDNKNLRELIKELKSQKRVLLAEKKAAILEAFENGKLKEKSRADSLSKLVQNKTVELGIVSKKLNELENHLKQGTTPQSAGFDFESHVVSQLQNEFPSDIIHHHGKAGDILHVIKDNEFEIGSIVYECKKTNIYSSEFIHQTKRAVAARNANFGILLTFADKKDGNGFFVENEIICVHPYSVLFIVNILRKFIIENYRLIRNNENINLKNEKILQYLSSNEFKVKVENVIYQVQNLVNLLEKEKKEHERNWIKRQNHYTIIANDVAEISNNIFLENIVVE